VKVEEQLRTALDVLDDAAVSREQLDARRTQVSDDLPRERGKLTSKLAPSGLRARA